LTTVWVRVGDDVGELALAGDTAPVVYPTRSYSSMALASVKWPMSKVYERV